MCHQAQQGTQCTGARLYLWPVVQTKQKVTPLVSAAVNASLGEEMGVCSRPAPFLLFCTPPQHKEGPEEMCVQCSPVRWHGRALHCGFINFSRVPKSPKLAKPHSWLWKQWCSHFRCPSQTCSQTAFLFFFFIPELQFKPYSDINTGLPLFVKWWPASPGWPGVQLIPHAWVKYHLCLFSNKGGTC